MMRGVNFGLFVCRMIAVASPVHGLRAGNQPHTLEASEPRYLSNPGYPQRDHPNYSNAIRSNHFDHPLNYKTPHYADDLNWPHPHDYNRRTFFHHVPYHHLPTTTPFPTFYHFMTSLFSGGDDYPYNRHPPTPPHPLQNPYSFTPAEPNYIPPPKPIRASVVKLESITRSPLYSSLEPETTTKYFHNVGTLLNHVLIENSKTHHPALRPQEPLHQDKIPPFKPLPLLPKPGYTPSPLTPSLPLLPSHHRHNSTGYRYPESVQDQLPHLRLGDPKIPYVSERPIPQIFDPLPTEESPEDSFRSTQAPSESGATSDIPGLIDIRGLNLSGTNSVGDRTKTKSFPGAVEKVKRPSVGFTKKVSTHPDRNSVERVANLTVQGLSKIGKESVRPQQRLNYPNVRELIGYEMSGLEGTTQPPGAEDSTKRLVNLSDELSLDAKILKDTNWDGFTTSQPEETTTVATTEPKKNKPAFWEIVEAVNATLPFAESTTPTTIFTTEPWPETSQPSTTTTTTTTTTTITEEETMAPAVSKRRSDSSAKADSSSDASREKEILERTIVTERTSKRRYSRRPGVVNFTPYATTEEARKRLTSRNYFPKRQKPNITLAFGNKNILKSSQSFANDEVMRFSDEEVRKRKIGKRREKLHERTRASTSERSARDLL